MDPGWAKMVRADLVNACWRTQSTATAAKPPVAMSATVCGESQRRGSPAGACRSSQAANCAGVLRAAMPFVLDAQHRAALLAGDPLAQFLVPLSHVEVRVVQPQRQIDLPDMPGPLHGDRHVVPLVADLAGDAARAALVAVFQAGHSGQA